MKLQLRFLSCLMTALMAFAPVTALAASEQVDFNKTGSVSVTIRDREKDKEVAGGSLLLYKVAKMQEADGKLYYEFEKGFSEFAFPFSPEDYIVLDNPSDETTSTVLSADLDVENPELLKAVVAYIVDNKSEGKELPVDDNGFAKEDNLKLGLYLIMQDHAAEGYAPVNPFFITIPMADGENLVYDVDASPKVETKTEETEPSTEPDNPPHNPPSKPPHLPQTGQLWWPVPLLAFAGLLFFTIGWKKRYNSRESK